MTTGAPLQQDISRTRTRQEWAATVEAIIFAAPKPVRQTDLQNQLPEGMELAELLPMIEARFDATSGIELCRVGDSLAFRTRAAIAERLNTHKQVERPLSRAALEVLAIIAYHQPITRAEIEEIRGISLSRGTVDILLELGWIKPRGRRRTPGRPLTWGTSPAFLDQFGLADLSDLPGLDDLKSAGLLRKGQVIGGLVDAVDDEDLDDEGEDDLPDLLEEAFIEADTDFADDEDVADNA
ncbi:MAG TPA: SMC-Scp complex subunit ScpB [Alphaproteobacteria bacterium]|jgi:segregation and condensation protein B|nr:MAG: SMC-Scp complex subunit ScpB [SAR116 cluster bacterium MED-G06]HCV88273.1 SMC-Scp complex subunit ScpB [Alphaproteobacteria bacterium]